MADSLFLLFPLSSNTPVIIVFLKLYFNEVRRAEWNIRYWMVWVRQLRFCRTPQGCEQNTFWGQMANGESFMAWNTGWRRATSACNYPSYHLWCREEEESKKEAARVRRTTTATTGWIWTRLEGFLLSLQQDVEFDPSSSDSARLVGLSYPCLSITAWLSDRARKSPAQERLRKHTLQITIYIYAPIKTGMKMTVTKTQLPLVSMRTPCLHTGKMIRSDYRKPVLLKKPSAEPLTLFSPFAFYLQKRWIDV